MAGITWAGFAFWGGSSNEDIDNQTISPEMLRLAEVRRGDIQKAIGTTGKAKIVNKQKLRFGQKGKVTSVNYESGTNVEKGAILAQLDDTEARKQLREATISYEQAVEKLTKLRGEDGDLEIVRVQNEVEKTEKALKDAEKNIAIVDKNAEQQRDDLAREVRNLLIAYDTLMESVEKLNQSEDDKFLNTNLGNEKSSTRIRAQGLLDLNRNELEEVKLAAKLLLAEQEFDKEHFTKFYADTELFAREFVTTADALYEMAVNTEDNAGISREKMAEAKTVAEGARSTTKANLDTILAAYEKLQKFELTENEVLQTEEQINATDKVAELENELKAKEKETRQAHDDLEDKIRAAVNDVEIQALAVEKAEKLKEDYILVAPFAGTIQQIDFNAGENLVENSEKYIYIENPDTLVIDVFLDQMEIVKVEKEQKVDIEFNAFPEKKFVGSVKEVSFNPEGEGDRMVTYKCVISVEKEEERILSGMTARINIRIADRENILLVPNLALTKMGETAAMITKVLNEEPLDTEEVEIKIGLTDGVNTEVISGLEEGQQIVEMDLQNLDGVINRPERGDEFGQEF